MIITLLAFIVISIVRATIVTEYDISPFVGAHQWLLIPDLAFLAIITYWTFIQEKRKVTPLLAAFFIAFLGSIIWDYQTGFYWLKFLVFPGILYVITHPEKYNNASLRQTIAYSFPIMHSPFVSFKQFFSELFNRKAAEVKTDAAITAEQKEESTDVVSFSLSKAIWFGIGLGLIILIALASLDPDFASFLQLTKWWDVIVNSFGSFLYYMFVFFWYFWKPLRTTWSEQEYNPAINTLLHRAVVLIVGIFVGYTFYDAYIILRALRLIQLTFETVGRNAQMNFLELVILGGGWLFITAFLLNKLKEKVEKKQSTISTVFLLLLVSCIWLIPPVINILRVLLTVYIPRFGLTARRLFGIYTTIAFILTFAYVFFGGWKKDVQYFSKVTISFFLTIILLSFALPTNLIIAQWHFSRYVNNDTKADFDYFKKLKLEKWGWIFYDQLDGTQYKSDNVWGLALAEKMHDKEKQEEYKKYMLNESKAELKTMVELLQEQKLSEFENKYGRLTLPFETKGRNIIAITPDESLLSLTNRLSKNLEQQPYMTQEYKYNDLSFDFNIEYEAPLIAGQNEATVAANRPFAPNNKRVSQYISLFFPEHRNKTSILGIEK